MTASYRNSAEKINATAKIHDENQNSSPVIVVTLDVNALCTDGNHHDAYSERRLKRFLSIVSSTVLSSCAKIHTVTGMSTKGIFMYVTIDNAEMIAMITETATIASCKFSSVDDFSYCLEFSRCIV